MIIATAGHIDHGKTTLIKALTGLDTDRLPEEKARGISIDLGFAHVRMESGGVASFVDVPGHERFIHNMLAGVGAIDAALVVVAADDGVMPQTIEHVHILDLLQVTRGIAVVTKVDRVVPARIDAVRGKVAALLSSTGLAQTPIIPVSATSGEGMAPLRDALVHLMSTPRAVDLRNAHRRFRLAIDRAFTVPGSGTVATGTILTGHVALGDELVVSPGGTRARVRGMQIHGKAVERAEAGQRCAINVAGPSVGEAPRGHWLVDAALHAPTTRFDARVRVLGSETRPLRHWTPVHLHLGTADVLARVSTLGMSHVPPGSSDFVRIATDRPIGALHGDRFVIRDASGCRTIGGGVVIDAFPERRRPAALRSSELAAMDQDRPEKILARLLEISPQGVGLQRLARNLNVTGEWMAKAVADCDAVILGREPAIGLGRARAEAMKDNALEALKRLHAEQPRDSGMDVAQLNRSIAPKLPRAAFQQLVRELGDRKVLVVAGGLARLPGHDTSSNPADEKLWKNVQPRLLRAGLQAPSVPELAAQMRLKEPELRGFLHRKSRSGELVRVTDDRYFLRETLAPLAATAQALARSTDGGLFSAAEFRDAISVGRTLAIQVLEHFDRLGITRRVGDKRRAGADFVPILGAAEPLMSVRKGNVPGGAAGLQIR